jgi:hypothetical protein
VNLRQLTIGAPEPRIYYRRYQRHHCHECTQGISREPDNGRVTASGKHHRMTRTNRHAIDKELTLAFL